MVEVYKRIILQTELLGMIPKHVSVEMSVHPVEGLEATGERDEELPAVEGDRRLRLEQ